MTTKEFFARHYGSLSTGLFALGLVAAVAIFGGDIAALTAPPVPEKAETSPPTPVNESASEPQEQESEVSPDAQAEPEQNPLEQAMADEAAKEEERRAALTAGANPKPEESDQPAAPAHEETASATEE